VTFADNYAVAGGSTVTIANGPSPYAINCIDATDSCNLVSTVGLSRSGSFTSTWRNSY
jgi:hypothetical protein